MTEKTSSNDLKLLKKKRCFKFGCKKSISKECSMFEILQFGGAVGQVSTPPCSLNKYEKKSVHSVKYELFTLYSGTSKS